MPAAPRRPMTSLPTNAQPRRLPQPRAAWRRYAFAAALVAAGAAGVALPTLLHADDPKPAAPLLGRINAETQDLFTRVKPGMVRVYLPPPQWAMDLMGRDFTLKKWDLQANMGRGEIREQIAKAASDRMLDMTILPSTTQPSSAGGNGGGPATQPGGASAEAKGYRLVPRGDGSFDLVGGPGGDDRAVIDVSPRSAGFVLDSQGHVLVPYFIEPESVGASPLTVACGDGTVCGATYVGSDPGTMLTILKLERPVGVPVALDGRRPADGSLVLFLSSTGESARLQVWTGIQQETGVVMGVDGTVHGFLRQGQFLEAARVGPVVQQILTAGNAKRQRVGVWIREVLPADALRREVPTLRDRPAVFVAEVVRNTPADRAGVRKGDLILGIGGETVGDPPTFAAAITPFQNRSASFHILRDGNEIELTVDLQRK